MRLAEGFDVWDASDWGTDPLLQLLEVAELLSCLRYNVSFDCLRLKNDFGIEWDEARVRGLRSMDNDANVEDLAALCDKAAGVQLQDVHFSTRIRHRLGGGEKCDGQA